MLKVRKDSKNKKQVHAEISQRKISGSGTTQIAIIQWFRDHSDYNDSGTTRFQLILATLHPPIVMPGRMIY